MHIPSYISQHSGVFAIIISFIGGGGLVGIGTRVYNHIKKKGASKAHLDSRLDNLQSGIDSMKSTLEDVDEDTQENNERLAKVEEALVALKDFKENSQEDIKNNTMAIQSLTQKLEDLITHLNGFND